MEVYIQAKSDHLVKLLVCLLFVLGTHVHADKNVSITFVEGAVEKGAVCLDGSPAAYYHDKGVGEGDNNWIVFLQGGAWCTNEDQCHRRSLGYLGSSAKMDRNALDLHALKSSNQTQNPYFYNWNIIEVGYCDGASYAADVEEVNPTNIHLRGARIFRAVVEELLAKGMKNANNVIFGGESAGALGAMLHCDEFRALVPNAKRVKCFADGGFFIQGKDIAGGNETRIKEPFGDLVEFHGLATVLPKSCTSKMDAKSCLYPENFIGDIQTPLFMVNSPFDGYQTQKKVDVGGSCPTNSTACTPDQIQILKRFRTSFLKALPKGDCWSKGMFIASYNAHIIADYRYWTGDFAPRLKNKTSSEAFADWYFDRDCFQEIDTQDTPRGF